VTLGKRAPLIIRKPKQLPHLLIGRIDDNGGTRQRKFVTRILDHLQERHCDVL